MKPIDEVHFAVHRMTHSQWPRVTFSAFYTRDGILVDAEKIYRGNEHPVSKTQWQWLASRGPEFAAALQAKEPVAA